jgi:2-furoyl-CoA dehydrogenase large subunit
VKGRAARGEGATRAAAAAAVVAAGAQPGPVRPSPVVRRWVGRAIKVKEDLRFVQGKGLYTDDFQLKMMLHAAVLRSPHAHARIKSIDASKVMGLKGAVATLTGPELATLTNPMPSRTGYPIKEYAMAVEKAVYAGQPVAAVAAESRGIAEDALELIKVDYERLPAIVDPEEAMRRGAPRIFDDVKDNTFSSLRLQYGDVEAAFREADLVLRERFSVHRYSSTPLEPDTVIAHYDSTQNLVTFYCNATGSAYLRAQTNGFPVKGVRVRFVIPDIGGTFGERFSVALQDMTITSLLSWKTGRPVKYFKDRREMLMAGTNGARDAIYHIEVALKKDGTILGHRLKDITNEGGSAYYAGYFNTVKLTNITGLYKMKSVSLEAYSVATNKGPGGSNRGLSKPHMGFVLERMVDLAARRLGLDPAEIRFRNLISPESLPYRTPSGNLIDAGNFPELLEKALEAVGYERWREEQKRLKLSEGRYLGVGIACNVDPGGANPGREHMVRGGSHLPGQRLTGATVRMDPLGKVTVQIAATNWASLPMTSSSPPSSTASATRGRATPGRARTRSRA